LADLCDKHYEVEESVDAALGIREPRQQRT